MSIAAIDPKRLAMVANLVPLTGAHAPSGNGHPPEKGCTMEFVAWVAREPWTDSPKCVSPVLGAFLRGWNDALDQPGRERLWQWTHANLPALVETGGDGKDETRAWLATDWLVRVCAPAWLELAGVKESPAALRALPPITKASVKKAQPSINDARKQGDAAWAAAGAAARDAARDAAWAAARDAARAAARAAAGDALEPTVVELQASAFTLLDGMVSA